MPYTLHILPHAQRDIKKLPTKALQQSLVNTSKELRTNPRPDVYEHVEGYQDVFRVYSEDRKYRIIYSTQEHLQAVIVISVRRRGESTYKKLPIKSLRDMIHHLEDELLEQEESTLNKE
jgi:mRNA-degrading endonuclease RelE of RelBE toxin-antitoxin system